MYPLRVILVGCNETVLPQVRQALHDNPAVTEAEFNKVSEAIEDYRWAQDETRLLIASIKSLQDVDDLQKLKRTFAAWPILDTFYSGTVRPDSATELKKFLGANRVGEIVVDQRSPGPWQELFGSLGVQPQAVAGVMLYRVPASILQAYVEEERSVREMIAMGHDEAIVRKVVEMVDRSEYKRRQAPPGLKITARAFGKDRRLPITNRFRQTGAQIPERVTGRRRR